MYTLIISEKPMAALKIATALADKKIEKHSVNKVPYYEIEYKGKKVVVACAVGHLYALAEKNKKGWTYPVFDIEWKMAADVNRSATFTRNYFRVLKQLTKDADNFVVATDYDLEGEVIGLNVIRYVCDQKDASRMKFSTLTKDELIESYESASKHLDWGQAKAGETRHFLDFFYGINLSRALTLAIKTTGTFQILSSGRVQGPTLKILTEREKEIQAFKSVPFWQIELLGEAKHKQIQAWHKEDKFWNKKNADAVIEKTKGKKAIVSNFTKKEFKQAPPTPFDLTTLQTEAYRTLNISPKQTLVIAQELYIAGYISYPRTSSQKLPPSLNYKKILTNLSEQKEYSSLCNGLLTKTLKPNEGQKSDPAHPAIYPTGEIPKGLESKSKQLYDLIVRRFLSTFAEAAVRQTMTIEIDVNKEIFIAQGTLTLKPGWHEFYGVYVKLKEEELPEVKIGEEIKVKKIILHEKETQPPKRYTPASIIRELEKRNLGTKATRAAIVDALYQRHYLIDKSITVTDLGIKTVETLEKYCPEILDEKLTRHFEEEMEQIQNKKKEEEEILDEAKKVLTKLLKHFKENEEKIGKELSQATRETRNQANLVGDCPNCKGNLRITYSKKNQSYFIACDQYPKCKTTFSVPRYALIKSTQKQCECGSPIVLVIRKGRRPFEFCINKDCPKKEEWAKQNTNYS